MSSGRCGVLLDSRMGRRGKREYAQVLRLLETFDQQEVHAAVKDAIHLGSLSFERSEAPGAVPAGGASAQAGSGALSLPAPSPGEHHVRRGLHDLAVGESGMNDRSTLLLEHHLKELKLPSFLREYGKMAALCAAEGCGSSPVPAAPRRTGAHRPPPAHGGAADTGRPLPLP